MTTRFPVVIDGLDFSDCFNRYAYSVRYDKRDGGRGGMMQDGSMTVDVLAWKEYLTLPCNIMTEERMTQLLVACMKPDVTATVYDPSIGDSRPGTFIPRLSGFTVRLFRDGVAWFGGATLTLEEK